MRFGIWALALTPLFDNEGPAGGGAPAGGGNPSASPQAPSGGTPSGQPSGTPASAQPGSGTPSGGGTGEKVYSYKEDRSNWVPSNVLRERTEKARAAQEQLARELEYERRRVAALTGVPMPKAPENPEHAAIRQQFFEVFPQFAKLAELDPEKLTKLMGFDYEALQRANQETSDRIWANHGQRARQMFETKVKELYGSDIDPKQVRRIVSAFAADAGEDDTLRQRYEAGDFAVIEEWLADWSKGFIDPIRKAATQPTPGQIAARRLPRAGGGNPAAGSRPATLKPSDGDKFHNAAFAAFTQSR